MAMLTQTKTIDDVTFEVTQLPARVGLKALRKLGKVLGAALSEAVAAVGADAKIDKLDVGKLGGAVKSLFDNLEDKDLDYFIDTFFQTATINGAPALKVLDGALQGRIDTLLKGLFFALEVNYGNFIAALAALAPRAQAAKTGTISTAG